MDADVITRLIAALEAHGVEYAVFGAVAMGLHGLARFTEDLDLFHRADRRQHRQAQGRARSDAQMLYVETAPDGCAELFVHSRLISSTSRKSSSV